MSDDIVVVDNGQTYETSESAIVAKNEADRAEQWAKYSEGKANLADERAVDAAESSDAAAQAATAAITAKEYAENAITDNNLITVATDLKATPSNIKTVAGSIANVNAVGENIDNVNAVAGNAANINAVNANKTNIDTVATNIDDVVMVAGIKDDVVIVSENISDVMTVADNIADVNNVSNNMTDVKAAVSSAESALASKNSAAQSETNAQIWAEGEDPQVTGLGGTHSAKKWAELAGSLVNVQPASETTSGIVRLSTTAEAKEGFDDSTAITPLKLAQVVADNVGRGIQLGFNGTLEGNILTFETTDPSPYTLRHNYDYEIDLLFQAVGVLSDDVEVVIKNGSDYINIVNVLHDDPTTHITVGDIRQLMKYNDVSGWRWVFMARYAVTANGNKVFVMPSTVINAVAAIPPQAGNAGKFLKTDGAAASWDNIAGGLEIGDIGVAPFGIDETKNTRRYLNGQVIIQSQFTAFTTKLKSWQSTRANLFTTEENWQAEKTNSKLGQCGKFVIDDTTGTIRLPCVVNINGLTDLANCGVVKSESLPNITGTAGQFRMNTRYSTGVFSHTESTAGQTAGGAAVNGYDMSFDASRSSSAYQDNAPVQQEAIQYPYVIQVATSSEENVDITTEIQLNNPFSLFESKYSSDTIINASWLISNGTYHSGVTYVTAYQALVVENNADVTVGSIVTLPNGTSYTKRGLSVKLSTEDYTDYDYVLNTADSTFRLPISSHDNGRVLIESYVNGDDWYNIYSDGWCEQGGFIPVQTRNDNYPVTLLKSYKDTNYSLITDKHIATAVSSTMGTQSFYTKNKTVSGFTTCIDTNVECTWRTAGYIDIESTGINLYYYIGETVQDANIINATGVLTRVANSIDRTIASDRATVVGWGMPDFDRLVNMGTTKGSGASPGTAIYTAPSDGWFFTQSIAKYTNNYVGVLITLPTGQQFSRTNGGSTSNENSGFEFLVPAGTTIVGNRDVAQTVYFAPLKGVN